MPAVSSRGRGRRTINEINMVPFIDVMLVLLIIFMVAAPLATVDVKVDLPAATVAAVEALVARDRWTTTETSAA